MTVKKTRAALYARYSTDRQDASSIEDQLRRCRKYAETHDFDVVAVYQDEAVSGAKMLLRDGMQTLLADARSRDRKFEVVLVDDLSRLGRDIVKTLQAVFNDLDAVGVGVIDCSNGMSSNSKGSRILFSALAMANDQFLQLVKTETHRGLEGRALAGFHTGGACYGFMTEPEPDPADADHRRAVVRIHPEESKVVRRIFDSYAAGASLGAISDALNKDRIPAPRSQGWSRNQLHGMLRNEKYMGRFVWNRREWFVDPRTEKRRYRERPKDAWVTTDRPELRIVNEATWAKVQERHRENARHAGRPGRNGYMDHILSGLLRCGECGSPMTIVSRKVVDGQAWSQYGCSARHSRGDTACKNRSTVSENKLNDSTLRAMRELFTSPKYQKWVQDSAEAVQRTHAKSVKADDKRARLQDEVEAQQRRVDRLAENMANVGFSETLVAKFRAEEAKLLDFKQALANTTTSTKVAPLRVVSTNEVLKVLTNIEDLAARAPAKARAALAPLIERILLTPVDEGYRARLTPKNNPAALGFQGGRVDVVGCGGRI